MEKKEFYFEVHGPCREYDYSIFCSDCADDAYDFAAEWLQELWDAIDVDDKMSITFITKPFKAKVCYGSCSLAKDCIKNSEDEN